MESWARTEWSLDTWLDIKRLRRELQTDHSLGPLEKIVLESELDYKVMLYFQLADHRDVQSKQTYMAHHCEW